MHVLQVTPYYPPTWAYGGIPRIVQGLARSLVRQGVQVTVLTTDAGDWESRSPVPPDRWEDGVRVLTVPNLSNRLAYHHQVFLPARSLPALGTRDLGPDVIHIHGHRHLLEIWAARQARRHRVPYVLTANGTLPRIESKKLVKLAWDRLGGGRVPLEAARCVAVSPAEIRQHGAAGIPLDRVVHIPNGLDLAEFHPLPPPGSFRRRLSIPEGTPIVAYLGRLSPRKGVEHLVAAFAPPAPGGAVLVVAGNDMGGERKARASLVPGAPVHFTGLLEGPDRVALLADADVLVYPSSDEIFGLVPFEGLLSGTPAVVCEDCGCGEIIREAGAGLLVPHGDVPRLRAQVETLLLDRVLARAMVDRGRRYVTDRLAWPGLAARHRALYDQVLAEAHGGHHG